MKKILISAFFIIAFVLYGVFHSNTETATVPTTSSSNSSSNSSNTTSTSSTYKDGAYTGTAADAFYGNIQVQATISGGKITNVTFLQYPSDRDDSVRINQQADPELAQEAIQAQSANVDIVSGATDTSNAFIQSLTSALNQAKS
jgi:uncharacterized protein with FMN-binding domain